MEQPDKPNTGGDAWAKTQAKADIAEFKNAVEDATVEVVDEPTGRKQVEVAWEDDDGFHVEEGEAYGVYRERRTVYHIDWTDDRGRTTVEESELVDLEESDWYNEDDENL